MRASARLRGRTGVAMIVALAVAPVLAGSGASLGRPAAAQSAGGGLVITEVTANGGGGARDAALEWVEIQNTGQSAVELEGWRVQDNQSDDPLGAGTLPPEGFLVLAGSAEEGPAPLPPATVHVVVGDGRIGNGLANSGDRVVLIDPEGTAVDGVSWGGDRTINDLPAPPAGQSLARGGAEEPFRAGPPSPGRATLGVAAAGVDPPPLRITEIFANAGAGRGDAALEWVELHNPSEAAVDVAGWQLSDNAASDVLSAAVLAAGERLVVAGTAAATPSAPLVVVIADGRLGNGLANDGDVVSLLDPAGRLVDRVDYSGPPLPRPEAGHSIALTPGGWVLNTEPSPGGAAVTPVLASISGAPGEPSNTPAAEPDSGGEGIPAAAVVAIALGLPLAAVAGREAWRRRPGRVAA